MNVFCNVHCTMTIDSKIIILREKDRSAKLIIKMQGQMTSISNPEAPSEY